MLLWLPAPDAVAADEEEEDEVPAFFVYGDVYCDSCDLSEARAASGSVPDPSSLISPSCPLRTALSTSTRPPSSSVKPFTVEKGSEHITAPLEVRFNVTPSAETATDASSDGCPAFGGRRRTFVSGAAIVDCSRYTDATPTPTPTDDSVGLRRTAAVRAIGASDLLQL